MGSSHSSPTEEAIRVSSFSTATSNSTSPTFFSKSSLQSLRRAASSFYIFWSKNAPNDEEMQASSEDIEEDKSQFKPHGPEGTKVRTLEECPNGYPRLSAFNSSEQNFMLYRGFSCVHARLLLALQARIQALESELDAMDKFHSTLEDEKIRLKSHYLDASTCKDEAEDGDRTRDDIMEELRIKVCQYDELLIKARELVSFQRPTNRDYRSVRNWFHNVAPLCDEEQEYILWKEDIVTLRHGREWAGFDGLVEEILHKLDCRLLRYLFRTSDQTRKTSDKEVHYYSPSRVSKLVNIFITTVIFGLLAAPILSMYRLSTEDSVQAMFATIGVLMVFTLLFAAAMSLLTKAKRHELFAASAAYCAVLVVFIGSTNFSLGNNVS